MEPIWTNRRVTFPLSFLGAVIVSTAILHASFTEILPLPQWAAAIVLLVPSIFIGLINSELRDSFLAMLLAVGGTVLLTAITRSVPAFLGIFPTDPDVFIFQQVGQSLVFIFPLVPFFVLGTMTGTLINEFILRSRYGHD